MRVQLASVGVDGREVAALVTSEGAVTIDDCNEAWGSQLETDLHTLIRRSRVPELLRAFEITPVPMPRPLDDVPLVAPYRRPGKIWGIGLNYADHARDLDEEVPAQPASFMKPPTAVIGPGEAIRLPPVAEQVTAEAEVGVVIGRRCRDLSASEAEDAVLGFAPIIDMTAEDILRQNPRYLTRSKSFDTFFSFGPTIVLRADVTDLDGLVIRTVLNGEVQAENVVRHMTFDPYELVRFHSQSMTLEAGDIISTGTPGACVIAPGDRVRCEITGFPVLENHVVGPRS